MSNCLITRSFRNGIPELGVFGVSRNTDTSSPNWTRTKDAKGMNASASVPTSPYTIGISDFNKVYPYKGIERVTLDTGDVMVKIPKFYYRRYKVGDEENIEISGINFSGSELHPAFNRAGVVKDYIYVGAYETSSGHKSKNGVAPLVNLTRDSFRTNAKSKGEGWGIIDIATVSAIQMLYLVEFANNNSQACIGNGNVSTSAAINTGGADGVPGLTGAVGQNSSSAIIYRGIENFWGNVWEFTDGLNWNGGTYYVCTDPSKYADDTATNYTALSYTGNTSWSESYITQEGLDNSNSWCMMPAAAGSGNASTYYTDAIWASTGWRVFVRGGHWVHGSAAGLFASLVAYASPDASYYTGSRLLYIPV